MTEISISRMFMEAGTEATRGFVMGWSDSGKYIIWTLDGPSWMITDVWKPLNKDVKCYMEDGNDKRTRPRQD